MKKLMLCFALLAWAGSAVAAEDLNFEILTPFTNFSETPEVPFYFDASGGEFTTTFTIQGALPANMILERVNEAIFSAGADEWLEAIEVGGGYAPGGDGTITFRVNPNQTGQSISFHILSTQATSNFYVYLAAE